jgi:phage terminase large subunit
MTSSQNNLKYGLTEVFVKHDYYASLRVKLLRKKGGKLYLLKDDGDRLIELFEIKTDLKIYEAKKGFSPIDLDFKLLYIYEDGDYSIPRYKYIVHKGSSRSSKSWSLEEWCLRQCETKKDLRINIWRDTRESLSGTIWADFKKLFPLSGRPYKFTRNTIPIYFGNNSRIEPHGADITNAHGTTQDIAWLNEPYKILKDTFDQIDQRSEQIIIDLNPKEGHWSDDLTKHPRCIVIHSTFMLNPFCPPEQKRKILGYNPNNQVNIDNKTADPYKWSVYGLGMKAERPNRIFRFKEILYSHYLTINSPVYYGVDWGVVDPMGILEAKFYDGTLYLHEISYKSENDLKKELTIFDRNQIQKHIEEGFLMWYFKKLGIDVDRPIICDNNRPNKVIALRKAGFERAITASKGKGSIIDGIDVLNNIDVCYTHTSINLKHEQENYSRLTDKRTGEVLEEPEDDNNHIMDPTRYIAQFLIEMGIINIL